MKRLFTKLRKADYAISAGLYRPKATVKFRNLAMCTITLFPSMVYMHTKQTLAETCVEYGEFSMVWLCFKIGVEYTCMEDE